MPFDLKGGALEMLKGGGTREGDPAVEILRRLSRREALEVRLDVLNHMRSKRSRRQGGIQLFAWTIMGIGAGLSLILSVRALVPPEALVGLLTSAAVAASVCTAVLLFYLHNSAAKSERNILEALLDLDMEDVQ